MDTKTILATLDGGLLDSAAAVRKLCEAVDTQGALLQGLRQNMAAAVETMKAIDAFVADKAYLTSDQRNDLVGIICKAMGETGKSCGEQEYVKREECDRLEMAEAAKKLVAGG